MKKVNLISLSVCLGVISCGGDSNSNSSRAFVTEVRVDPSSARVGEEFGVRVNFEPEQSNSLSSNLQRTIVVLKLPGGVDYVTDSSDFDGSDVGGYKKRNPNRVEICPDNTRALTYIFDGGELTDNENKIRLSAKAFEAVGEIVFRAEASGESFDTCNIFEQNSDNILIIR